MRSRLLVVASVALLGLVAGGLALWVAVPRHNISLASFEAIKLGMSEPDVEAILGVPAGDYSHGKAVLVDSEYPRWSRRGNPDRAVLKVWLGDEEGVSVWFLDGKVVSVVLLDVRFRPQESFPAKLRRWLRL